MLKKVAEKVDALLEVWFPGTEGANAIADVILGEINPSGRLTMSFPQATGQCPIYYNHYNTGRPHNSNTRYVSRYQDIPTESYYPFGYGLSYSDFEYSDLKLATESGEGFASTTELYQAMRERVQEEFKNEIDKPTITTTVNFVELANTKEYQEYK